jgi:hypothetical protein
LKDRSKIFALALTAILLATVVFFWTPSWVLQKRATLDSPLVQRVLASPVRGDLNSLLVPITLLNSLQITDSEENYHNDTIYLERHLERLYFSEIAGLPKPDIPTIADSIAYEKEASSSPSLQNLRQQAYMTALIPGAPDAKDKPPQEIIKYPDHYIALGKHRWTPKSAKNLTQIALALKNRLDRDVYLPPIISVSVNQTGRDVEFVCANGAKAPWEGGGGMPPEWRLLSPNERALVLCDSADWDSSPEEALEDLGKQNYWSLNLALYPPTRTGLLNANSDFSREQSDFKDSLLISGLLSTQEIAESANLILQESSCLDRKSCLAECSSVLFYHGEIWMFGFILGALTFSMVCSFKGFSRFRMALILSAIISILCLISICTIDQGGILAEMATFVYTLQALGAILGVWLIHFVFYRHGHSHVRLKQVHW